MTVVFVHGNPETTAVWDALIQALDRKDTTCISPPGFGAPAPEGWGATREDYRDWLIEVLEGFGTPVDLVGHDWGAGHVAEVAMSRPDLLRSWCIDVAGVFHPDYVWHDFAQTWQTPGEGEVAIADLVNASKEDRTAFLASLMPSPDVAERLADAFNATTGRCILALYRSAAQPAMAKAGERLPEAAQRPGLVVIPTEDPYVGTEKMARASAERAGADVAVLDGLGHWWMVEDPQRGAGVLTRFWSSLRDRAQ
jgi:pimeloyl-ACP methyl ester carboxylesterase